MEPSWLLGRMNIHETVLRHFVVPPHPTCPLQMARLFLKKQQKFACRHSRAWGCGRKRQEEAQLR